VSRVSRKQLPIAEANPSSLAADAYHAIRTNIQFRGVGNERKSIFITSANRGEGRSTTAANLAVTFCQAQQHVLLVDADLRKPSLHTFFDVQCEDGLSNFLLEETEQPPYIKVPGISSLTLLPSGPQPRVPASLFASRRFEDYLEAVRYQFDVIIIDGPPVLATSEALNLAKSMDGTIVVIDAQRTNRISAQRMLGRLQELDVNVVGAVLNRLSRQARKYPVGSALQTEFLSKPLHW